MGWIRCIRCKKLQRDFVGRTFVLIAPVQYVLYQVSCSYETIPNTPNYCETDRDISLGSNRVDWVRWLKKIRRAFAAPTFCINCTSSPCFATSFMQLRNDPKCTQTLSNVPKHEFRVQWGGSGVFVEKKYNVASWDELVLIAPVQYVLHQLSCTYETMPNAPKYYETLRNISLRSNVVDGVRWLPKIIMQLRVMNFCIICTSSVCFATSFM